MYWRNRRVRPVTGAIVALSAALSILPAACQAPRRSAARYLYLANCDGHIYKIDVAESRLAATAVLYERAKDIPHGRGTDGCSAEGVTFDARRSELVVLAPRDASGEQRRLQLVRFSAGTLQVAGQDVREEHLPAHILASSAADELLLGVGVPGDEAARIVALDTRGQIRETWTGSGFGEDARLLDARTILSREYRIVLQNGRANAGASTLQQLLGTPAGAALQPYASEGVITAGLAGSAGLSALYLITTPGVTRAAGAVVRLDRPQATVVPLSTAPPLSGLHLSADGEQVLAEQWTPEGMRTGALIAYDAATGTAQAHWDVEAIREPGIRFVCSGPDGTYIYAKGPSLLLVKAGSSLAKTVPLTAALDPDVVCAAGDR